MSGCNITPIKAKACSGKCKGGGCGALPRVWVVAACEGMISLFEKDIRGALVTLQQSSQGVFASLGEFQKSMDKAEHAHKFDQLIVVGSNNDIAWIHASLPAPVTRRIAAEIEYPLMSGWFKQPSHLENALKQVFVG